MAVHDGTWQYIFHSITVYGSTWRYIQVAVHDWISAGLGGASGRFWCAFVCAALHALSVAIASSHCMHKLVHSSFGTPRPGSLGTVRFASLRCSRQCFGRGSCLASRRCQCGRGRLPRGVPGPTGGRRNLGRRGGGSRRRVVCKFSGEAAFDDLGLGTSACTRNFEDAVVERDQSGSQFCPKSIRAHGVKLFENGGLVFKCAEWGASVLRHYDVS